MALTQFTVSGHIVSVNEIPVYGSLSKLYGFQHGESFAFCNKWHLVIIYQRRLFPFFQLNFTQGKSFRWIFLPIFILFATWNKIEQDERTIANLCLIAEGILMNKATVTFCSRTYNWLSIPDAA